MENNRNTKEIPRVEFTFRDENGELKKNNQQEIERLKKKRNEILKSIMLEKEKFDIQNTNNLKELPRKSR